MTSQSPLKIKLLYFDGCPNHEPLKGLLEAELMAAGLTEVADVEHINIESPEMAVSHRFLGSPSLRVNGVDVDPVAAAAEAAGSADYGYKCRVYQTPQGPSGLPPVEWVRDALQRAGFKAKVEAAWPSKAVPVRVPPEGAQTATALAASPASSGSCC